MRTDTTELHLKTTSGEPEIYPVVSFFSVLLGYAKNMISCQNPVPAEPVTVDKEFYKECNRKIRLGIQTVNFPPNAAG